MQVQVIGPGCANCRRLYAQAEIALAATGVAAELEKVERREDIEAMGIWMTPGLAIDGEIKSSGRIPGSQEIAAWLTAATDGGSR